MMNSRNNTPGTYAKRSGTSGIQGHLYETKLLSLIYFRAINDENIEEFHLATNADKLGSFDDICFRTKVKNIDKPISVFIQAKHRENNAVLTLNSKSDLVKYFKSYLDIKNKFNERTNDVLFDGTFDRTECFFVIYTTAKGDQAARKAEGRSASFLNALIGTEVLGSGLQPMTNNSTKELNQILLEEEMIELARLMAKCVHGEFKNIDMLMQEELVSRYHVVLAQQVFDVSNDPSGEIRDAFFRQDFFNVKEGPVQLFKEELCNEILKRRKFASSNSPRLRNCFSCCGVTVIDDEYQEIKHLITYKNQQFKFLDKMGSERYKPLLDTINESQETIRRTVEIAVKQSLPSLKFRVPASFGNKDLTLRGSNEKKERKLIDLKSKIVGLIKKLRATNIVKLYESVGHSLGEGFLQLNGGLASAVGNLLVLDDDTKLLKFNDNHKSLGKLAKKLFDKLNCEIENLYEYKFDVRVKMFPKLSFDPDEYTKSIVSDFSKKFLFYTSQAKEDKVERILINLLKNKLSCRDDILTKTNKANKIFLNYHDAMLKWWMKKNGEYLTKEGSLYRNAEKDALSQPLVSFINMMQRINNKNYTFTEDAVNLIKLDEQLSGTVIVTKNIALTVAKLINYLIKKDCVVLDMKYILSLSTYNAEILQTEPIDLNKENTHIVACDKTIFDTSSNENRISKVTSCLRNETAIIILNDQDSVEYAKKYFKLKDNVITDERNNLLDMSEETHNNILENTNVIFQGYEVSCKQVLDDSPLGLVGELVLHKLMQNELNFIGKPVCELNDKGKLYIERSVKCLKVDTNYRKVEEKEIKSMSTLYDLRDDVVLIFGDPGMGKSTLLTQLSLKTKQIDKTIWILRINLLEYSKQFFEWQDEETVIDNLKCLKFLCQVALSEGSIKKDDVKIILEELNGTVSLKYCDDDEWTVFELNMFLHYYNTKQLIILFDGFDEICPTYVREVISLIKSVINLRKKHKIWIASRSYDKIITELDLQLIYKIEPLDNDDQDLYLSTFWEEKNLLKKICQKGVRNNLSLFCQFMSKSDDVHMFKKKIHLRDESIKEKPMLAVYLSLYKYLKPSLKYLGCKDLYKESASQFSGLVATPLHLNMLAEHLYNRIEEKGGNDDSNRSIEAEKTRCLKFLEIMTATGGNLVQRELNMDISRTIAIAESAMQCELNTNVRKNIAKLKKKEEKVADDSQTSIKWDFDVNLFEIYEHFVEYKLKIRFHDKNRTDMYKPYNREQYRRELADTKDKLKKLAAFAVYNKRLLEKHDLKRCEEIIDKLKEGEEITDIICNIVNGMPIFVHSTFAEYFAIEYISDLIKTQRNLKNIYNFILNVMFFKLNKNVLVILDAKIKVDNQLTYIIGKNKGIIFRLLLEQGKVSKNKHGRIKSSLCEAIRLGLRNLAFLLLSTSEEYLYESNLMDFIEIVKETNMLKVAVKMGFDELLIIIVNRVRMIRESKLNALLENIEIFEDKNENLAEDSTSELVQKLHANVWTRMDIVPDWENLRELGGQIYFI